jgi:hypothetical protein
MMTTVATCIARDIQIDVATPKRAGIERRP